MDEGIIMEETKPKKVNIEVIRVEKDVALVQWIEDKRRKRGYIPVNKIDGDKVDESVIKKAKPFGIPFADIIKLKASSQELEDRLYDEGIWTIEDLNKKSKFLPGILQSVYAVDMAALITAARNYEN